MALRKIKYTLGALGVIASAIGIIQFFGIANIKDLFIGRWTDESQTYWKHPPGLPNSFLYSEGIYKYICKGDGSYLQDVRGERPYLVHFFDTVFWRDRKRLTAPQVRERCGTTFKARVYYRHPYLAPEGLEDVPIAVVLID